VAAQQLISYRQVPKLTDDTYRRGGKARPDGKVSTVSIAFVTKCVDLTQDQ